MKIYFGNITTVVYFDYMMLLVSMCYRFLFRASLRVSVYEWFMDYYMYVSKKKKKS